MAKKSVFDIVTEQILKLLEQGVVPWQQQWQWQNGLPQNYESKRPYTGFNLLYLSVLQQLNGWETSHFLTFRKIKEHGWHIRKGEQGNLVVFWKVTPKIVVDEATGEEKDKTQRVLRYYWVWNLAQLDGVKPEDIQDRKNEAKDNQPLMSCEDLISTFLPGLPEILRGSPRYVPSTDLIFLPDKADFKSSESYYNTRFHETVHSTGATRRLNRPGVSGDIHFGSETYSSFEELIAEMGAAFLAALTGISTKTEKNEAAYIQAWLHKLQDNPTWVIKAASEAQKAVNYLLDKEGA
jgi:antirestriction protein ArdC